VVVVGSVNADYVVRVAHRPEPGETVGDCVFEVHGGGKGANQALAAVRSGAAVSLVAHVGDDEDGRRRALDLLAEGVDTGQVGVVSGTRTGVAFITVTPDGENSIAAAPGANATLLPTDIDDAVELLRRAAVLVVQLELPLQTVARALELVPAATTVVLNYSPAQELQSRTLRRVSVLVANEGEASALSGLHVSSPDEALRAARRIRAMGPRAVVVTLGAAGAVAVAPDLEVEVPAPKVRVVDTTGAGDALVGALAARLAAGADIEQAVEFGVAVGSATTEQMGALPCVPPNLQEVRAKDKRSLG
jgi:ribokinase